MYNPVHLAFFGCFDRFIEQMLFCEIDCIALFKFSLKNLWISVVLIDVFSSIAAHLWQGYTFFSFPTWTGLHILPLHWVNRVTPGYTFFPLQCPMQYVCCFYNWSSCCSVPGGLHNVNYSIEPWWITSRTFLLTVILRVMSCAHCCKFREEA